MISQSVKQFLGPVIETTPYFTKLENGGVYISPEQLANAERDGADDRRVLAQCIKNIVNELGLTASSLENANFHMRQVWNARLAGWGGERHARCAAALVEFAFVYGLSWGAYLARREKK